MVNLSLDTDVTKKPWFGWLNSSVPSISWVHNQSSARQGLQLKMVDRAQQSLELLRCFAAKHSRSEHVAEAWMCLSLMWLLVLAFLSHVSGWRPVFCQTSSCNVPLFIIPANTAATFAFHEKKKSSGRRHDDKGTCLTQWFNTEGVEIIDPFSIWIWFVGFAIRCGLQQVGCLAQPQLALTQSGAKGGAWLPVGSCGSWMRALLLASFLRTISNTSFKTHAGFCRAPSEDQVLSVISLAVQFIPRKRQIHCTENCQLIFRCSHKCSGGNWINFLDSAFFQLCHTSSFGKSGCLWLNQATCASFD